MGGKGSGGHNRKGREVRELEGNAGHRPINEQEPVAPTAPDSVPSTLTPLEADFWKQLFPVVTQMKVMSGADVWALGQLCRFLAEERECSEQIAKTGRLIPKKNELGQVVSVSMNPLVRIRSDAARHVRAYFAVFGLGPSYRAGLQAGSADDPPQDPLEDFLSRDAAGEITH